MKVEESENKKIKTLMEEREYYKFYKELYEKSYRIWRTIALALIGALAYIATVSITFILLASRI